MLVNWKSIVRAMVFFLKWEMKYSIQRGEADWNGAFLLSPNKWKYFFLCTNDKTVIIRFI